MTKEEAIYCMMSYLPDNEIEHCVNCPYDGAIQINENTYVCRSSEAHKMAIEALKRDDPEVEFQKRFEKTTFCGYSAKELLMFAKACRENGVDNLDLKEFSQNVSLGIEFGLHMFNKQAEEMVKGIMS